MTGLVPLGVIRIEHTRDGKTNTIADNDNMKPMYAATGRYGLDVDVDMSQQKGDVTLTYTGKLDNPRLHQLILRALCSPGSTAPLLAIHLI